MRITIGSSIINQYTQSVTAARPANRVSQPDAVNPAGQNRVQSERSYTPSIVRRISPEGRAAYNASLANASPADAPLAGNLANLANLTAVENARPASAPLIGIYDITNVRNINPIQEIGECQTCANRAYVDRSNDGSVSFQTPTRISPDQAPAFVMAHENEHVANEQERAEREGRNVLSQWVIIHMDICPECGIVYVAGGETNTITAAEDGKTDQERTLDTLLDMIR